MDQERRSATSQSNLDRLLEAFVSVRWAGRLHARIGDRDHATQFAGGLLEAARDVDDISDHRELEPLFRAEIADDHRTEMDADGYRQPLRFSGRSLGVPPLDLSMQLEGAGDGTRRGIAFFPEGAERGHEAVAEILVERALVTEHNSGAPLLKAPQKREGPIG